VSDKHAGHPLTRRRFLGWFPKATGFFVLRPRIRPEMIPGSSSVLNDIFWVKGEIEMRCLLTPTNFIDLRPL